MTGRVRGRRWRSAAAVVVLLAGCEGPPTDEAPSANDGEVLATWQGGQVRAADLEARILELPAIARRPDDGDFAAWYGQLVRDIAVERMLAAAGESAGLAEGEAFARRWAEARRAILANRYAAHALPPVEPLTEADLEAYHREHPEQFERPAQRRVYQLFRRYALDRTRDQAVAEVADLRARVLAGEPFSQLAAAHSESESRHRDGLIGLVTRGQLAPELDALIFALEPGVPSEPVPTGDGVHLFLVDQAVEAKTYSLEEAGAALVRRLLAERQRERVAALAGDDLPADAFVPTSEELVTLLSAGDPNALVLRVGDLEMRRDDFLTRLEEQVRVRGVDATPDLANELLAALVDRELLSRRAIETGVDRQAEIAEALARARRSLLAELELELRVTALVEADEAGLRAAYARDARRYSEPLRLRLRLLELPNPERPAARMAALEAARADLARGGITLEALADAHDGRVTDLGWLPFPQLQTGRPTLAARAVDLGAGAFTAPFRTPSGLAIAEVVERAEPRPLTFEQARGRVRDDRLVRQRDRLRDEVAATLFEQAGFRLDESRLTALADRRRSASPTAG